MNDDDEIDAEIRVFSSSTVSSQNLLFQDAHLHPSLDQIAHARISAHRRVARVLELQTEDGGVNVSILSHLAILLSCPTHLLEVEEFKLGSKGHEMGKEGVEVAFAAEVDQVGELGMVDVSKDSHQLLVDVSGGNVESRRKVTSWQR